ncbi:unnamed protein product [Blepharisma stoltei]|uniref:E3 ubiquitin-protein ligase HACE1 n=1 Tax=Blepharisma stoltei TaxID=1481888 RepID=A0AAU9JQK3_9CILI|nr:unnamed protein product [Blepharisma stoltei]
MEEALELIYSNSDDFQVLSFLKVQSSSLQGQDHLLLNIFHHLVLAKRSHLIMGLFAFDTSILAQQDLCGKTVLHFLAEKRDYRNLEAILKMNPRLGSIKDSSQRTVWHTLLIKPDLLEIFKLMEYCSSNDFYYEDYLDLTVEDFWNIYYKDFQALIWEKALDEDFDLLKKARKWTKKKLSKDINTMEDIGLTLLKEFSIKAKLSKLKQYLSITPKNLNYRDFKGKSAIMYILESDLIDIEDRIDLFLGYENSVDLFDNEAKTPIHYLLRNKNIETQAKVRILRKFRDYNQDMLKNMISAVDVWGENAFSLAANEESNDCLQTLLYLYGETIGLYSITKQLPSYFISTNNSWPYYFKTQDKETFKNFKWKYPVSPLEIAIEQKSPEMLGFLIANGFNANSFTNSGKSILEAAILVNDIEIIKTLTKNNRLHFYYTEASDKKGKNTHNSYEEASLNYEKIDFSLFAVSSFTKPQIIVILLEHFLMQLGSEEMLTRSFIRNHSAKSLWNINKTSFTKLLVKKNAIEQVRAFLEFLINNIGLSHSLKIFIEVYCYTIYFGKNEIFNMMGELLEKNSISIDLTHEIRELEWFNEFLYKIVKKKHMTYYATDSSDYKDYFSHFYLSYTFLSNNPSIEISKKLIKSESIFTEIETEETTFLSRTHLLLAGKLEWLKRFKKNISVHKSFEVILIELIKCSYQYHAEESNNFNLCSLLDLSVELNYKELFRTVIAEYDNRLYINSHKPNFMQRKKWFIFLINSELFDILPKLLELIVIYKEFSIAEDEFNQYLLQHLTKGKSKVFIDILRRISLENLHFSVKKLLTYQFFLKRNDKSAYDEMKPLICATKNAIIKKRPLAYYLCENDNFLQLIKEILDYQPQWLLWTDKSKNLLTRACKYGQLKIIKLMIAYEIPIPTEVFAKIICAVSLLGYKLHDPFKMQIWNQLTEENLKREAVITLLINYYTTTTDNPNSSSQYYNESAYSNPMIAASSSQSEQTIMSMLEKCFIPEILGKTYKIKNLNMKNASSQIGQNNLEFFDKYPLKECLLHNQEENVALVLIKYLPKDILSSDLYQECILLASKRKWWKVLEKLMETINPTNKSLGLIAEQLVKENQLNLLEKLVSLAVESRIGINRAFYTAIAEKNMAAIKIFASNLNTFWISFGLDVMTSFKFSPDLRKELTPLIKMLGESNPLKLATALCNCNLVKEILSTPNNHNLIICSNNREVKKYSKSEKEEMRSDDYKITPLEIAALNGFWQLLELYLDNLPSQIENIKDIISSAILYAIIGESVLFNDRYIQLPNYIPKQISSAPLISRYICSPSKWSCSEDFIFPNSQQDYNQVLQILLNSERDIEPEFDSLIIASFYGQSWFMDYIKGHLCQSSEDLLNIFTASINGYIYRFAPNFYSFYGSSCSKFLFKLGSNYNSPEERKTHKQSWNEFLVFLSENLSIMDIENTHQNKMKFLHIFYICLHYHLLDVAVPLFQLVNKLEVEPSIFGGILITAARIGDIKGLNKLLDMGANPDWCQALPPWELVPRYDANELSSYKEHEDLGPWSDSDSSSVKNEEAPRSNFTATLPTALHWAAERSDEKMIDLLLQHKARINIQVRLSLLKPYLGKKQLRVLLVTPLDVACLRGNWEIISKLGEVNEENLILVFMSGKIDSFIKGISNIKNLEEYVKSKKLLNKACRHGFREIAEYLLQFYRGNEIVESVKRKGLGILHYCAINGNEQLIRKIIDKIPEELQKELFDAKTAYGFTPYLLSKYVSKTPMNFIFSNGLTDISSYLLLQHSFCTSFFSCPKYPSLAPHYHYESPPAWKKIPLIFGLSKAIGSKNIPLLYCTLKDNLLIKDIIKYHEKSTSEEGKIIDNLYKEAIKSNNLWGMQILRACGLMPSKKVMIFAAEQGRDDVVLFLFEYFGISDSPFSKLEQEGKIKGFDHGLLNDLIALHKPESIKQTIKDTFFRKIAEPACRTGCRYTIELILSINPLAFDIKALESIFGYNYFDLGVLILLYFVQNSMINSEQIEEQLKSIGSMISEIKLQALLLELVQRGIISENNWNLILSHYDFRKDFDEDTRFLWRDKLFFHTAAADLLRNEVNKIISESSLVFLKEKGEEELEKYIPYLKSYISYQKSSENELIIYDKKWISIEIDQALMSELVGIKKGWQKILCLVQMFSSSGLFSLLDTKWVPNKHKVNYLLSSKEEPSYEIIPDKEINIKGKIEIIDKNIENSSIFSSVQKSLQVTIEKPIIISKNYLQAAVKRYLKFFNKYYLKGKAKLRMIYDSIPQEHYETIIEQFKLIKKVYKTKNRKIIDEIFIGKACGALNLLMAIRMIFIEEHTYYKHFRFEKPREPEAPRQEPEPPVFTRSVSGVLRPTVGNEDPPQEITDTFNKVNLSYVNLAIRYVEPENYEDSSFDSDEWKFTINKGDAIYSLANVSIYNELKLKVITHRLFWFWEKDMINLARQIEFELLTLYNEIGLAVSNSFTNEKCSHPLNVIEEFFETEDLKTWFGNMLIALTKHKKLVLEAKGIYIDFNVKEANFNTKTENIDDIVNIYDLTFDFKYGYILVTIWVYRKNPLLEIESNKDFPIKSVDEISWNFLTKMLTPPQIMEEILQITEFTLKLNEFPVSESIGSKVTFYFDKQSLYDAVSKNFEILFSDCCSFSEKLVNIKKLEYIAKQLQSRTLWDNITISLSQSTWDDLMINQSFSLYTSSFILGNSISNKIKRNAQIACNRHFSKLKRSYLLNFSISNLSLICKKDDTVLINTSKVLKIKSIDEIKIMGNEEDFPINKISQIFKVYKDFPSEEEIEMKEGPIFICDSAGRIWFFDQESLPKYEEAKGELYKEKLRFPKCGEIYKPIPKEISLQFSENRPGLNLSLTKDFDIKVNFVFPEPSLEQTLLSNPNYYELIDNLCWYFKQLRKITGLKQWNIPVNIDWNDSGEAPIIEDMAEFFNNDIKECLINVYEAIKNVCDYNGFIFDIETYDPNDIQIKQISKHEIAKLFSENIKEIVIKISNSINECSIKENMLFVCLPTSRKSESIKDIYSKSSTMRVIIKHLSEISLSQLPENTKVSLHKDEFSLQDLILFSQAPRISKHFDMVGKILNIDVMIEINQYKNNPDELLAISINEVLLVSITAAEMVNIPSIFDLLVKLKENTWHEVNLFKILPADFNSVLFSPEGVLNYIVHFGKLDYITATGICYDNLQAFSVELTKDIFSIKNLPENSCILIVFFDNGFPIDSKIVYTGPQIPKHLIEFYDSSKQKQNQYKLLMQEIPQFKHSTKTPPSIFNLLSNINNEQLEDYDLIVSNDFFISCIGEEYSLGHQNSYRYIKITPEIYLISINWTSNEKRVFYFISKKTGVPQPIMNFSNKNPTDRGFLTHTQSGNEKAKPLLLNHYESYLQIELTEKQLSYKHSYIATSSDEKLRVKNKSKKKNLLIKLCNKSPSHPKSLKDAICSRAGCERSDLLLIRADCDLRGSYNINHLQGVFKHKQNPEVEYEATIYPHSSDSCIIKWTPFSKGFYIFYLNSHKLKSSKPIYVCPAKISPSHCIVANVGDIFQMEKHKVFVKVCDEYKNFYSPCDFEAHKILEKPFELNPNAEEFIPSPEVDLESPLPSINAEVFKNHMSLASNVLISATLFNKAGKEYPVKLKFLQELGQVLLIIKIKTSTDATLKVFINNIELSNSPIDFTVKPMRFEVKRKLFFKKAKRLHGFYENHNVDVVRTQFLESLRKNFNEDVETLRGYLNIKFEHEPGIDGGGLSREFFDKLGREIVLPEHHLFIQVGDFFKINPLSSQNPNHLELFHVLGAYFAKAILHKYLLEINFAPSIYKQLLGRGLIPEDLKDDDPIFYNSLKEILTMDPALLEYSELTFVVTSEDKQIVELIPNGAEIKVTAENRQQYFETRALWHLYGSVAFQMESFTTSFQDVITLDLLSFLNPEDLQILFNGSSTYNLSFIKKRTSHYGPGLSSQVVQWLWTWLENSNEEILKAFLRFVTGSSRIPYKQRNWGIVLSPQLENGILPTASTCGSTIYIPNYKSYKEFSKFMTIAVLEGSEGYGTH